jgi:flagellar biosynthesis protein FliR
MRLLYSLDDGTVHQIKESSVAMFAAGVGSCISTILAYLLHASEKKDFDVAYTPWYFARPLMGMLLGLIFYFVLKGGLLVLTMGKSASGTDELNLWHPCCGRATGRYV